MEALDARDLGADNDETVARLRKQAETARRRCVPRRARAREAREYGRRIGAHYFHSGKCEYQARYFAQSLYAEPYSTICGAAAQSAWWLEATRTGMSRAERGTHA